MMRLAAFAGILLLSSIAIAQPKTASKAPTSSSTDVPASTVLVVVNDKPITQGDLDFYMLTRSVPEEQRPKVRKRFLEQLVERRLIQAYLAGRKVQVDSKDLDGHVVRIKRMITKAGDDPARVFARLGYDEHTLRDELSLPLAWQAYLARVVTPESVREFFHQHRAEFDGTEIRASQIFLKLGEPDNEARRTAALEKLRGVRAEIAAGKITFADAAKTYSEAPSRDMGGDVGYFGYQGKMPVAFTQVVFPLKVGEVSEPFATKFGAHLATVTERKPGTLSLEDVRPRVLSQLSNDMWNETVAQERAKSKIEWR